MKKVSASRRPAAAAARVKSGGAQTHHELVAAANELDAVMVERLDVHHQESRRRGVRLAEAWQLREVNDVVLLEAEAVRDGRVLRDGVQHARDGGRHADDGGRRHIGVDVEQLVSVVEDLGDEVALRKLVGDDDEHGDREERQQQRVHERARQRLEVRVVAQRRDDHVLATVQDVKRVAPQLPPELLAPSHSQREEEQRQRHADAQHGVARQRRVRDGLRGGGGGGGGGHRCGGIEVLSRHGPV